MTIYKICSVVLTICLLGIFLNLGWGLYKLFNIVPKDTANDMQIAVLFDGNSYTNIVPKDTANDMQIAVLFDGNSYTCRLDDTLASVDVDSYKSALDYCEKWKQSMLEYEQRSKRSWKEVQGGVY